MPFARPSLSDLRAQLQADIAAALPGADPLLPVSNLGVLADICAEILNGAYGYEDYIARQTTPFQAVDEVAQAWGGLKGVLQKPASKATGQGTWPGVLSTPLPAETQVVWGGIDYITTADGVVDGSGFVTVPIEAVVAGSAGTLVTGGSLLISQAIPGITSTGVATAGVAGADVESIDAFRTRYLQVFANPPQGGALSDYVEWALQVSGVTRAWAVGNGRGIGTVVVYTMFDDAESAFGGFPQGVGGVAAAETRDTPATQDLLAVADFIYPLEPVTALVYALAPQANTVTMTINLPGVGAGTKAAVAAAVANVFLTFGAPGGVVNMSDIHAAIVALDGTDGYVITAEACSHGSVSPTDGNITSNAGFLPVLGTITWTP